MEFAVAEQIIMPKMGESITEGTIVKWLKKEGESIDKNENIVLITTDKVEAEIPAPSKGFLIKIYHKEGDVVPVGEVLGTISNSASSEERPSPVNNESISDKSKKKLEQTNRNRSLSPLVKKLIIKYNLNEDMVLNIKGSGLN